MLQEAWRLVWLLEGDIEHSRLLPLVLCPKCVVFVLMTA